MPAPLTVPPTLRRCAPMPDRPALPPRDRTPTRRELEREEIVGAYVVRVEGARARDCATIEAVDALMRASEKPGEARP